MIEVEHVDHQVPNVMALLKMEVYQERSKHTGEVRVFMYLGQYHDVENKQPEKLYQEKALQVSLARGIEREKPTVRLLSN